VIHPAGPASADFPPPNTPPRLARALLNAVLFLAACAAGCALLGRVAPFPEVPGIYPKWTHFREHRDDFDVLFLGSSRFYHQIIPAQFDAAVGAAGQRVNSFNFGYDGMWPPESYYLLRQLLALRPARLKWVVIDLMDLDFRLDERTASTKRMAYWHDLPHTLLACRDILASRDSSGKKASLLAKHGSLCVQQFLNLGRGAETVDDLLAPRPPRKKDYFWAPLAGYEPHDRHMEAGERESFLLAVEGLKKGLFPATLRPVFRDALAAIIRDVRCAGAKPVFVIAPTIKASENFTAVPDGAPVFAFNDPTKFPQLFDPARHYDSWHLNATGAVDFTRELAAKFLEHQNRR